MLTTSLLLLDEVEDELTAPDQSAIVDPLLAKRSDRLDQGYVVKSVLGQGATARPLLVTKAPASTDGGNKDPERNGEEFASEGCVRRKTTTCG